MQEKGSISIHTENIFPIIKKFLYSDHEIFLRELVSNAVDASQKIQKLSSIGEFTGELGDLTVAVEVDKEAKTITIKDRGIGMTAEEVKKYINQIAFSGATEFVEKYKETGEEGQLIGMFGLGFYSAFMVAKEVDIITKSHTGGAGTKWTCDGSTSYEISEVEKEDRGTEVVLHIADDSEEFLEEFRIRQILDKYCKFLPIAIKFGKDTEFVKDEEGNNVKDDKGEDKKIETDHIINADAPIWVKSPSDLTDQDYLDFYKKMYPMSEDPLFWIHLNVDYPFNLTGVLYFPKVKNDFDVNKNKIHLYSRQVFITDEVKDIVPEFLQLLHGIIDSPDIPLNVSRSFLQSDSNVKKISNYITKKVADKLNEQFRNDRENYEKKWDSIGLFVKYGMISDEKFYDKAKKFALVESTEGKFYTVDEYKEAFGANQTDKDGNLVVLYATDLDAQYGFVDAAKQKGYDVVKMDTLIDNHFVNGVEQKFEKVTFKRVDADVVDKLIDKDEKKESVLTEDESTKVKELYEKVIADKNYTVTVDSMATDDMPVIITRPEFMRRMKDMQANGGGGMMMMGGMPDMFNLSVNANHGIIQKILKSENEEEQSKLAKQAIDLAKLSQNMLTGADLSNFIKRSVNIVLED
ncbi:molecular chaperone HtpG [Persicobacter diffluens]|uniref:Chaperone protein HtpG n=1 Tax=Persicobacter diffluens TaxID=981 RepID=A0AAN5AMQ5_9BACT|nr:chaperone protein HtpG [Persicobacter diffluens]